MVERPILFSAPMLRALLAGTKTQTRRVCKPAATLCEVVAIQDPADPGQRPLEIPGSGWFGDAEGDVQFFCPYGKPGDRLWVREAHYCIGETREVFYRATDGWSELQPPMQWTGPWKPSIHMPHWASRILLEVTEVRVERLQDISEADAIAEGCITKEVVSGYDGSTIKVPAEIPHPSGRFSEGWDCARDWYADLWESINGPDSWEANPWVWAVSFKRITP